MIGQAMLENFSLLNRVHKLCRLYAWASMLVRMYIGRANQLLFEFST